MGAPIVSAMLLLAATAAGRPCQSPDRAPDRAPPSEWAVAQKLFAAGEFGEAERRLALMVAKDPSDGALWNLLGTARHAQKRFEGAVEAFDHAAQLLPDQPTIRNN